MEHCETEYGMTGCVYPRRQNTSDAQTLSAGRCLRITCTDTTPECVPTRAIVFKKIVQSCALCVSCSGGSGVTEHVPRGAYSSSLSSGHRGNLRHCKIKKDDIWAVLFIHFSYEGRCKRILLIGDPVLAGSRMNIAPSPSLFLFGFTAMDDPLPPSLPHSLPPPVAGEHHAATHFCPVVAPSARRHSTPVLFALICPHIAHAECKQFPPLHNEKQTVWERSDDEESVGSLDSGKRSFYICAITSIRIPIRAHQVPFSLPTYLQHSVTPLPRLMLLSFFSYSVSGWRLGDGVVSACKAMSRARLVCKVGVGKKGTVYTQNLRDDFSKLCYGDTLYVGSTDMF
ncbi:hypothetical protein E2C01_061025 [Portunus trituberculatus]|uniref:Uncharacterized protein n=1 Tax=Portunus trituberculatus TaxID=210409 RepID=A0A5B7H448_PORTR|nr:hypothetical protein [Portunus trituberculatus]